MEEKFWEIESIADEVTVKQFAEQIGLETVLARILVNRGISTFDTAKEFFRPDLQGLHNPFLMTDMDKAVNRLLQAVKNNEKILIYGDYDVDGISAVAMVYKFLHNWHKNIGYYIPDRYSEGYGISIKGIDYAADNGYRLVIALDCGIKAIEKMKHAKSKNIDFIICDHHNTGEQLPEACAVLDPKRHDCNYPYKELSGCGVGFKLLQAYSSKTNIDESYIMRYIDFVAVSIASDIVPITGENRVLTYYGLEKLNTDPHIGFKAIVKVAGLALGKIDVNEVVFKIGPRINAAGRIDSGQMAVDLLVNNNLQEAISIAYRIDEDNTTRKEIDRETTIEAINLINLSETMTNKRSTVLFNPHWHKGIVGIVASRLVEQFYRPAIILTRSNGMISGSARSVPNFNIYEAIAECSDLLETYGGHMYAAGLSLKEENLQQFIEQFEKVVESIILPSQTIQKIICDAQISISQITPKLWGQLKALRPFGPGNMAPVFISRNVLAAGQCVGKDGAHMRLMINDAESPQKQFPAIAFNLSQHWHTIANRQSLDICYTIDENEYRGKFSLQLRIKDIKKHQFCERK